MIQWGGGLGILVFEMVQGSGGVGGVVWQGLQRSQYSEVRGKFVFH